MQRMTDFHGFVNSLSHSDDNKREKASCDPEGEMNNESKPPRLCQPNSAQ